MQAAHGVEAPIGAVPWSLVGAGWTLAMWSPVTGRRPGEMPAPGEPTTETSSTALYLVDPAGGRYAITTFPPPGDKEDQQLVDWSGDGNRALLNTYSEKPTATVVDLHTGTQTTVPVQGDPRFTRPEGKALLVSTWPSGPNTLATLKRVDLAGNPQLTYPTDKLAGKFSGMYLSTPDGTRLVLGTSAGLVLMGNDGKVGPTLSVPDQTNCTPLRWWDGKAATTVLTKCEGPQYVRRLWLVPVSGDTPTALTAPNDGQKGPDIEDMNAWKVPAGTFVQAAGGCGFVYLAKLNPDGTTTQVSVPDVDNNKSIDVVGVNGGNLDLHASAACGGGQLLVDYDPAANKSTVLLGAPLNGGGVDRVLPFPGQE
jgi:TolB protein